MRKFEIGIFAIGLCVMALSFYYLIPYSNKVTNEILPGPVSYNEMPGKKLSIELPSRVGGGGVGIVWSEVTIKPKIIFPEKVTNEGSFLVGVIIDVVAMSGVSVNSYSSGEGGYTGPISTSEVSLASFSAKEREQAKSQVSIPVRLALAGVEVSPSNEGTVSGIRGFWWSVAPKKDGLLTGRVLFGNQARPIAMSFSDGKLSKTYSKKINEDLASDVAVLVSGVEQQNIGIEIDRPVYDVKYILSIIGAIFGALLASLPAWIAWFEKIRGKEKSTSA